tara:strand:- start:560 stop:1213 length:654 start_codon:yes stop_codon:yes gene_type:complete
MVKCVMTELTESCNFPGGVKIREEPLAEDESTAPITLQMTNLALFFANVATPTKAAKSVPSLYNRYVKKGESMALLAKLRGKYGDALVDDILLAPLTYEPITRAQLAAFFAANNPSKVRWMHGTICIRTHAHLFATLALTALIFSLSLSLRTIASFVQAAVSIPSLMKRYVEKGQGDELIVKLRAKYGDASVHASFVGMIKPKEDVEQEEEEEEKEL